MQKKLRFISNQNPATNVHLQRNVDMLKRLNIETEYMSVVEVLKSDLKQYDALYLNWFENIDDRNAEHAVKVYSRKCRLLERAKKAGLKIIFNKHNIFPHQTKNRTEITKLYKKICDAADVIICFGEDGEDELERVFPGNHYNAKIQAVHPINYAGAYRDSGSSTLKERIPENQSLKLTLFGKLMEYKNPDILIEVAKKMKDKKITFILAGEPVNAEYREKLEEQIGDSCNIVPILERLSDDDVAVLLDISDLFVMPYDNSNASNSGTGRLAFSYGVPAISVEVSSMKRIPDDLIYKYTYKDRDSHVANLYQRIEEAYEDWLNNPKCMAEKGEKLLEIMKRDYSVESIASRYEAIFEELFQSKEVQKPSWKARWKKQCCAWSSFIRKLYIYDDSYDSNPLLFRINHWKCLKRKKQYISDPKYAGKMRTYSSVPAGSFSEALERMEHAVWKGLVKVEPNGEKTFAHIRTFEHSSDAHELKTTKTFCLALKYRYQTTGDEKYKQLFLKCVDYILKHKYRNGLYRCEQPFGLEQDEGPTTAGVIQVLCYAYEMTQDKRYLTEAISAAKAARCLMCNNEGGYLHTINRSGVTTNICSSFAVAFALLYQDSQDKTWYHETLWCLDFVYEQQAKNGMFYYGTEKRRIYLSLYHYMVVIALLTVQNILKIDDPELELRIKKAIRYSKELIFSNGVSSEPDMPAMFGSFISTSRAALMFGVGHDSEYCQLTKKGVLHFFDKKDPRILIDMKGKVTDGKFWYRKMREMVNVFADLAQLEWLEKQENTEQNVPSMDDGAEAVAAE